MLVISSSSIVRLAEDEESSMLPHIRRLPDVAEALGAEDPARSSELSKTCASCVTDVTSLSVSP